MGQESRDRSATPRLLEAAAAITWRALVVAGGLVALGWVAARLSLVVLPAVTALLLAALLWPLATFLRRRKMGPASATWATLVLLLLVLVFAFWFIGERVAAQIPAFAEQFGSIIEGFQRWLAQGPLGLETPQLDQIQQRILDWLTRNQASLFQGLASTTARVIEILAAFILTLFITFFFLYDGPRIWNWFVSLFSAAIGKRVDVAGREAWATLKAWILGTFLIALFHGTVISASLLLLRIPLVAPLALLVFIGSFIPIIGSISAGVAAVMVALFAKGLVSAVVVLAILVVMNQAEGNLLQPLVIGHYVRLHPLGLAVVLAVGVILGGIAGAIIAVPLAACLRRAWHAFFASEVP
jgi:predicted PurR-regulated permease PerM